MIFLLFLLLFVSKSCSAASNTYALIMLFFNSSFVELYRSSHPELFLVKDVLKICSKFIGGHPCNFIKITLWHGCSHVNLLHIFRTPFHKSTSGRLLLFIPFILKYFSTITLTKVYNPADSTLATATLVILFWAC